MVRFSEKSKNWAKVDEKLLNNIKLEWNGEETQKRSRGKSEICKWSRGVFKNDAEGKYVEIEWGN